MCLFLVSRILTKTQDFFGFLFLVGKQTLKWKSYFCSKVEMIIMFKLNTITDKWTSNIIIHERVIYSESCVENAVYANTSVVFLCRFSANDNSLHNRKLSINYQISFSNPYGKFV